MKRVEFEDYRTELAHRLAIAEASVFSRVTYASAERTMNAVHRGKEPGAFWLAVADLVIAGRKQTAEERSKRGGPL